MQDSATNTTNNEDNRILIYKDLVTISDAEYTLPKKQIISCYKRSASSPRSGMKRQYSTFGRSHGADQNKRGPMYVAEIFTLERN